MSKATHSPRACGSTARPKRPRTTTSRSSKTRSSARSSGSPRAGRDSPGSVLTAEFELNGLKFVGLNGGPEFTLNEAISFQIHYDDQERSTTTGTSRESGRRRGERLRLGRDKYGVSWQVIPKVLYELIGDSDPDKAGGRPRAMLGMKKLDVAALEKAHAEDKRYPCSRGRGEKTERQVSPGRSVVRLGGDRASRIGGAMEYIVLDSSR